MEILIYVEMAIARLQMKMNKMDRLESVGGKETFPDSLHFGDII